MTEPVAEEVPPFVPLELPDICPNCTKNLTPINYRGFCDLNCWIELHNDED